MMKWKEKSQIQVNIHLSWYLYWVNQWDGDIFKSLKMAVFGKNTSFSV